MDDFEGFKTSVEEVIADEKIPNEIEVETLKAIELLLLMIKFQWVKICFLGMSKENGSLRGNLFLVKMLRAL
jgi:hypothetical protein